MSYLITDEQMKTYCNKLRGKYSDITGNSSRGEFYVEEGGICMTTYLEGLPFIKCLDYVNTIYVADSNGSRGVKGFSVGSKDFSKEAYNMLMKTIKDIQKYDESEIKKSIIKRLLGG